MYVHICTFDGTFVRLCMQICGPAVEMYSHAFCSMTVEALWHPTPTVRAKVPGTTPKMGPVPHCYSIFLSYVTIDINKHGYMSVCIYIEREGLSNYEYTGFVLRLCDLDHCLTFEGSVLQTTWSMWSTNP